MNVFLHELRHAVRNLAAQPGFSLLVVGVLGVGLACVIFMLVMVNSFVLRPLPFPEPARLLQAGLAESPGAQDLQDLAASDLVALRRHLDGLADVAGFSQETMNLSDIDRPERFNGAFVSANLWRVLGVAPVLGRDFTGDDGRPGATRVAVISHTLWQHRYGGDPGIVGRQVRINAEPATVVGVMPERFSYPFGESVWSPRALEGAAAENAAYTTVLRHREGVAQAAVDAAVAAWFADASAREPDRFHGVVATTRPLDQLTSNLTTRAVLDILLAAVLLVLLVLLVACANSANLLLTRTLSRRQELAVRVALGASRGRLVAHLLAQSMLLSGLAVAVAIPLAMAGAAWQQASFRQTDNGPPLWLQLEVDATVIGLACALALLTALLTGLLPALRAAHAMPVEALRDGTRTPGGGAFARISRVLVVGEVALCCLLLVSVGTLVRGIGALDRLDLGIDTRNLLTARMALFPSAYPDGEAQLRVYDRLLERLRAEPEVVAASAGTVLPARMSRPREVLPDGRVAGDAALPRVQSGAVEDAFLAAYGIALREGRFFDARDIAGGERVAVVDQRFVERVAGGGDVVGRRFRLDPRDTEAPTVTIVGVIAPLTLNGPASPPEPTLLVPLRQEPARFVSLAVRTRGDAMAFAPRLAALTREVEADTPLYWVRDIAALIRSVTYGERIVAQWFAVFGLVALLLAGTGLYGVMSASVGQRIREIGVRRALGAPARSVLRDLFGRSLAQLAIGLVLGLALGIPFARALTGWLTSIPPGEAGVVPATLAVLVVASVLAIALPARRALRVDPMVALRHE